ncbi:interleukin-11 [Hyperolius riggenbachi]|uniref:interleukin-11 n=1 Tax=Hyperolius riggenbachi TaxID=752182 RepID=UPI0035A3A3D7
MSGSKSSSTHRSYLTFLSISESGHQSGGSVIKCMPDAVLVTPGYEVLMDLPCCLYQIALAIVSVCEGVWSLPLLKPKPTDSKAEFDSILHMAKHLLNDTKHLYTSFKSKYPYEGDHKLESLPVLTHNAAELSTIQVPTGLTKLSSELFIYQKHFDWLKKAAHVVRPMDHEFIGIHNRIEKLVKKIDSLMAKLNIARASDSPLPQLPTTTSQWGVVQTGHAIFHHFHLFLDYATRALVVMKNKL